MKSQFGSCLFKIGRYADYIHVLYIGIWVCEACSGRDCLICNSALTTKIIRSRSLQCFLPYTT